MKKVRVIIALLGMMAAGKQMSAQVINWGNTKSSRPHWIHAQTGLEHGLVFGAGYAQRLKSRLPIVLGTEFSTASGENLLDDFKVKIGGQVRLYRAGNVQFSARLQGVFRRNENTLVRLLNFGSDIAGVAGYYREHWFAAGEAGFDKAIVTHFKHSEEYKKIYPEVQDGWFEPATGGNFYYGIQGGYSFRNIDITLRAGRMLTQDFKTKPLVPYYGSIGVNLKLK